VEVVTTNITRTLPIIIIQAITATAMYISPWAIAKNDMTVVCAGTQGTLRVVGNAGKALRSGIS